MTSQLLNQTPEENPLATGWFLNTSNMSPKTLAAWAEVRPNLFSSTRVWVDDTDLQAMATGIAAIERVLRSPAYQEAVAQPPQSPPTNGIEVPGVLYGYDFHLSAQGPRLIEINTNAGGAFLTACLGEAWEAHTGQPSLAPQKQALQSMFEQEWLAANLNGQNQPDGLLVIVDEDPQGQYLYPEFELCRMWLQELGWRVAIAAPEQLVWNGIRLQFEGQPVAMVYNRLTDFSLETALTRSLRQAYDASAVLLTPHPQAHAEMADKGHLVHLADDSFLASLAVPEADRRLIAQILLPCTKVSAEDAENLWQQRKTGFFKPVAGYGGKAAYRGDKLTRRVFDEILAGDYIVQQIVPAPERVISLNGETLGLKFDVRNYTYQGRVLGVVARLYQGQTTNFRTPGGGFAPVYSAPR